MEHGVDVATVMAAGIGGGSGVRSDGLFAVLDVFVFVSVRDHLMQKREMPLVMPRY